MANPFSKGWKYMMSAFDQKIDENADPEVQINQAVAAAKEQHQAINKQAAAVIGNKTQLEMKLNRLVGDVKKVQDQARQALQLADAAAAKGDQKAAGEYTNTAEVLASQLVSLEQQLDDTKQLHAQATAAAGQAQTQAKDSELRLKEQLGQLDQLRTQATQASMQEKATQAMESLAEVAPDRDVPTLDQVRDKIERRYANALGAQDLLENNLSDRMAEITQAGTDFKASARLDQIRAELRGGTAAIEADATGQLTPGAGAAADSGAGAGSAADAEQPAAEKPVSAEKPAGEKPAAEDPAAPTS